MLKKILKVCMVVILILGVGFIYSLYKKGVESQKMNPTSKLLSLPIKGLCADKPNCVSSFDKRDSFYIPAKKYDVNPISKIQLPKNCKIKSESETHQHYHCISSLFGFVDDLELLYQGKKLYFYSASRVGYSDLDANRKRVELIKEMN